MSDAPICSGWREYFVCKCGWRTPSIGRSLFLSVDGDICPDCASEKETFVLRIMRRVKQKGWFKPWIEEWKP